MRELASGVMVAMYLIAALFFLRFYRRSKDKLFAYFAVAFAVLGCQRLALGAFGEQMEYSILFYTMRFAAFLVILAGIWSKNRSVSSR